MYAAAVRPLWPAPTTTASQRRPFAARTGAASDSVRRRVGVAGPHRAIARGVVVLGEVELPVALAVLAGGGVTGVGDDHHIARMAPVVEGDRAVRAEVDAAV